MGTVHAKVNVPKEDHLDTRKSANAKIVDLNGVEARVDKVHVEGLVRTKDYVVKETIKELFATKNFEDMIKCAHNVRSKLFELGCFRTIGIHVDTSSGPSATASGYEVTFHVEELSRIAGSVQSHVDTSNNEGMLSIGLMMPNLFGAGESIKGECTHGSKRTRNFNITAMKPFISAYNPRPSVSIFQNDSEWPMSGYKVIDRGISADLFCTKNQKLKHNLIWEGVWREMGVANKFASMTVREGSGHSLKSAIKYIISHDLRDSNIFPTEGSLVKLSTEIAGLGGNVSFLKNDLQLQYNKEIFRDVIFQGTFNVGLVNPLGNEDLNICDHFFLGGPINLRGFEIRAIGPRVDNDFIGGNYYWAGALHIFSPLPFRPGSGGFGELFRTHLFVNAGNVGKFKLDDVESWVKDQNSFRLAAGLGVALKLGHSARVELNYCYPILFELGKDATVKGLQFGVGVNFL